MFIRFPPRRILVPHDFSPTSKAALETAQEIGRLFGSRLDLVSVLEPFPEGSGLELAGAGLAVGAALTRARGALPGMRRRLREEVAGYGGATTERAFAGAAPRIIARLAQPKETDLAVMGTHGYKGLERVVYGSVAEAVVASSRVPVLTVRKLKDGFALRSLLCPVNMTPYSAVALSYAALMAQAAGASLTALYVRPESVWEEDARLLMGNFLRETLGASALSVRALIAKGEPREEIARQAEKGGFDAVILSAHRRPWTSDLLLGATAQRVLRSSSVPVLSVPATIRRRGKAPEPVWPVPGTRAIF